VQPGTASDHDRGCIIDAAYGCLYEPHTGPIPVAAILLRAGVSTRAFYRHFESKDELFLAMLRQESDALAGRLDRIVDEVPGAPADQLKAWIGHMFGWMHDAELRMHLTVIDSDEVRAAKGYRETREQAHADRERSLVGILRRGRDDSSFPLADPECDAVAISAVVARVMVAQSPGDEQRLQRSLAWTLEFALRAVGADPEGRRPAMSSRRPDGLFGKVALTRGVAMPSITPSLWFDNNLEEAAQFYTSIFPNSSIETFERYTEAGPGTPGDVVSGMFVLDGTRFCGINGGPEFQFTEAVSFMVECKDQDEVDYYWDRLVDGGEESQCGWLKDRFGLSWQIVPTRLFELTGDPDRARAAAATKAMLGMRKIVIAQLEAAVR
jgi:predicted 3-demethylubiquinone-9 3-methyltransferase (glyoxalase superfamily)/AcrR family transcriptional regulator